MKAFLITRSCWKSPDAVVGNRRSVYFRRISFHFNVNAKINIHAWWKLNTGKKYWGISTLTGMNIDYDGWYEETM
jgi:hypothetical protein